MILWIRMKVQLLIFQIRSHLIVIKLAVKGVLHQHSKIKLVYSREAKKFQQYPKDPSDYFKHRTYAKSFGEYPNYGFQAICECGWAKTEVIRMNDLREYYDES